MVLAGIVPCSAVARSALVRLVVPRSVLPRSAVSPALPPDPRTAP